MRRQSKVQRHQSWHAALHTWNNAVAVETASKCDPTIHSFYFDFAFWLKFWLSRGFEKKIWFNCESKN
jgi:hypothetical protein